MRLDMIKDKVWEEFEQRFPEAVSFLLEASLTGELEYLEHSVLLTGWEIKRREELRELREFKMTKREAAIVSAYTGVTLGKCNDLHKYIEGVMEKICTYKRGTQDIITELKKEVKSDFESIIIE